MQKEPDSSCPLPRSNSSPIPFSLSLKNVGHYVFVTLRFNHGVESGYPWGILSKVKEGDLVEMLFEDFKIVTGENAHEVWMLNTDEEKPLCVSKDGKDFQLEKICLVFFEREPNAISEGGTWFWNWTKAKVSVNFAPPQLFEEKDLRWIGEKQYTFRRWVHQNEDNTEVDWHLPVTNWGNLNEEWAKLTFQRLEVNKKMVNQILEKGVKVCEILKNGDERMEPVLKKMTTLNELLAERTRKDFWLATKYRVLASKINNFDRDYPQFENTLSSKTDDFDSL